MGKPKKGKSLAKKNRKTKSVLVFDETARKDYLTGFKKRKDERRKRAQEEIVRMLKEDRKLLKQKTGEFGKVKTKSEKLQGQVDLAELAKQHTTELPQHTVTITDISAVDIAGLAGTRLGCNTGRQYDDDDDDEDDVVSDTEETQVEEGPSLLKQDRSIKNLKNKIEKTKKHLKRKSNQKKKKRTLSKKKKHKKKMGDSKY